MEPDEELYYNCLDESDNFFEKFANVPIEKLVESGIVEFIKGDLETYKMKEETHAIIHHVTMKKARELGFV